MTNLVLHWSGPFRTTTGNNWVPPASPTSSGSIQTPKVDVQHGRDIVHGFTEEVAIIIHVICCPCQFLSLQTVIMENQIKEKTIGSSYLTLCKKVFLKINWKGCPSILTLRMCIEYINYITLIKRLARVLSLFLLALPTHLRGSGLVNNLRFGWNLVFSFANVELCLRAAHLLQSLPLIQTHLHSKLDHHLSILLHWSTKRQSTTWHKVLQQNYFFKWAHSRYKINNFKIHIRSYKE